MTDFYAAAVSEPAPRRAKGLPQVWELIALTALFVVYVATIIIVGDQGTLIVNLVGPTVMGIILLLSSVPNVMRDPNVVWTPLFWFRITTVVYFGFGNLIIFFASDAGKAEISTFYAQYLDLVTKLNAVITLGVLMTLSSAFALQDLFPSRAAESPSSPAAEPGIKSPKTLVQIGSVFLVIGTFVKIFFVLPTSLGINTFVLPGALGSLSLLGDAGIYMIAVWAWRYRPAFLVIPFFLSFVDVTISLLAFAKSGVIAAILVLALAWLSKGITVRRVLVTAGVLIITFAEIVPFVTAGRSEMQRRYQSLDGANLAERLEIASYYFNPSDSVRDTEQENNEDQQTGLIRFSYVTCGTFALSLYDSGNPGGTLATLPATFVPRALWPDKPDMTIIGREFNYLATGNDRSASSPGWMAEMYWDYGWFGLPLIAIPLGIILQIWSTFSLSVVRMGRWIYFPFCLLGMKTGTTVDGFIVPDVMGPAVLAVAAFFALKLAIEVYKRNTSEGVRPVAAEA